MQFGAYFIQKLYIKVYSVDERGVRPPPTPPPPLDPRLRDRRGDWMCPGAGDHLDFHRRGSFNVGFSFSGYRALEKHLIARWELEWYPGHDILYICSRHI